MHVDPPFVLNDAGLHTTELTAGAATAVIEAPVPFTARAVPSSAAPMELLITIEVAATLGAMVTVTTAATPLAMVLELIPYRRQV